MPSASNSATACIMSLGAPGRYTKFKGSFGPQKAIAQIRLEYADGSVEIIGTDENWRVAAGPITFSSIYGGEDFDARLVQHGWNQTNFDDSKWSPAIVVNGPGGELRGLSCAAPPIREFEIHKPVSTHTLTNGDVVFDLGQNAAHVLQISVSGPAGSAVRLIPAELTDRDGSVWQGSMGAGHRGIWLRIHQGHRRRGNLVAEFFLRRLPLCAGSFSARANERRAAKNQIRWPVSSFIPPPHRSANLNAPTLCSTASARSSAGRSAQHGEPDDRLPAPRTARLAGGGSFERPGAALRIRPRATVHQDVERHRRFATHRTDSCRPPRRNTPFFATEGLRD